MFTARCGHTSCDHEISKRRKQQAIHAIKRHGKIQHGHTKHELVE